MLIAKPVQNLNWPTAKCEVSPLTYPATSIEIEGSDF